MVFIKTLNNFNKLGAWQNINLSSEPDDEKRYKHIIENMIYVSELQPKNMFLYMNAIDPINEYNLNIYTIPLRTLMYATATRDAHFLFNSKI
jgi:hypothetical protein